VTKIVPYVKLILAVAVLMTLLPNPAFALFENLTPDQQQLYFTITLIVTIAVFWLTVNKLPWWGTIAILIGLCYLGYLIWPGNWIWTTIVGIWNWFVDNTFIDSGSRI
jgi:uncharacterized membrane protein YdbT with pleckstrin-like domain